MFPDVPCVFSKLVEGGKKQFPTYALYIYICITFLDFLVTKYYLLERYSHIIMGVFKKQALEHCSSEHQNYRLHKVATVCRPVSEKRLSHNKYYYNSFFFFSCIFNFCLFVYFSDVILNFFSGSQHSTDKLKSLGCRWIHLVFCNHFHLKGKLFKQR